MVFFYCPLYLCYQSCLTTGGNFIGFPTSTVNVFHKTSPFSSKIFWKYVCLYILLASESWRQDNMKVPTLPMASERALRCVRVSSLRPLVLLIRTVLRWWRLRSMAGMILTGANRSTGKGTCPSTSLYTTNSIWQGLVSKLSLHREIMMIIFINLILTPQKTLSELQTRNGRSFLVEVIGGVSTARGHLVNCFNVRPVESPPLPFCKWPVNADTHTRTHAHNP